MLVAQSPISAHQRPRSGRKPLQPRNSLSSPLDTKPKPNLNIDQSNKENVPPISSASTPVKKDFFPIETFDASLAEELSAIREKLERVRVDKEKTAEMLRERAQLLDSQMKEIVDRGVLQKHLEIEVDRLFRLKEIKLSCTNISPIRSLREKEQAKKIRQQQDEKAKNHSELSDDRKEESKLQTSNSQVKAES